MIFFAHVWDAVVMAAAMAWQVAWSLVLGFTLSGLIAALVSKDRMQARLGRSGVREIALATLFGAASSSCSYAAASMSRTLFARGAGFAPSLAFLFASTNLVVELGLVLYLLMGWQFTLAEWIGGLVLVAIMTVLVKLTYPRTLVEAARARLAAGAAGEDEVLPGATLWTRLRDPQTLVRVARTAAMDWSMLRDDLGIGFLIAGALAVFVPPGVWHGLFLQGAPAALAVPYDAVIGALLAIVTFVCSIGNVPMAAILWGSGISFGGVLAFLYADLIVLPLLDVYRKYYGTRLAAYIFGIFFVTMVASAIIMDLVFTALHQVPVPRANLRMSIESFSFDATFWLNVAAGLWVGFLFTLNRKNPMTMEPACCHHDETAAAVVPEGA